MGLSIKWLPLMTLVVVWNTLKGHIYPGAKNDFQLIKFVGDI